jgi:hypothetical protein
MWSGLKLLGSRDTTASTVQVVAGITELHHCIQQVTTFKALGVWAHEILIVVIMEWSIPRS